MNLVNKIQRLFNIFILISNKINLGNKLLLGKNAQLKINSRIKIWDQKGKIIIGHSFSIGRNSELYCWDRLIKIGDQTSINDNCKIYGEVNIGSNCLLASNIFMSSGGHNFSSAPYLPIKVQDQLSSANNKIVIEDDCWIGWGVVIMPGVYIGKGAIIGANAVVTKNIAPYTINAGVPSKQIGERLAFKPSFTSLNCKDDQFLPFFYKGLDYNQFNAKTFYAEGLSFTDQTAVFLFAKSTNYRLKIVGSSNIDTDLAIYLNDDRFANCRFLNGAVEVDVNLTATKVDLQEEYVMISEELKKVYNIVIIKLPSAVKVSSISCYFKIISIGLYEN